jgi:hypothetical protein
MLLRKAGHNKIRRIGNLGFHYAERTKHKN